MFLNFLGFLLILGVFCIFFIYNGNEFILGFEPGNPLNAVFDFMQVVSKSVCCERFAVDVRCSVVHFALADFYLLFGMDGYF